MGQGVRRPRRASAVVGAGHAVGYHAVTQGFLQGELVVASTVARSARSSARKLPCRSAPTSTSGSMPCTTIAVGRVGPATRTVVRRLADAAPGTLRGRMRDGQSDPRATEPTPRWRPPRSRPRAASETRARSRASTPRLAVARSMVSVSSQGNDASASSRPDRRHGCLHRHAGALSAWATGSPRK